MINLDEIISKMQYRLKSHPHKTLSEIVEMAIDDVVAEHAATWAAGRVKEELQAEELQA